MNGLSLRVWAALTVILVLPLVSGAQTGQAAQTPQTLTVAGQTGEVTLVQVNGKTYVDIDSLARLTRGSLRFRGTQVILTLPGAAGTSGTEANKPSQLSQGFLVAEIEALTQIREWRVSLGNAIQNNYPVTSNWVGPLDRSAEAKLQLAIAAATTEQDHEAVQLLQNEFNNMQQLSNRFLTTHADASYIAPDSFANDPMDQKILSCERALASMAATKQYQDEPSCH